MRLTPPTFRTFVMATAWSVSNMTDGAIPTADLPLVPFSSPEHATELVNAGLWAESEDGYQIVEYAKHQTSAAQVEHALEARREADRKRQAKKRERDSSDSESRGQSRDGHVTSEGKERQGKARKGKALEEEDYKTSEDSIDLETGEISEPDWDSHINAAWHDPQRIIGLYSKLPDDHPRRPETRARYYELMGRPDPLKAQPPNDIMQKLREMRAA
ncbi:hypothetical protein [Nesterenkonia sphaerica]|uniref:Uncharacterized protein n=1 Tax=Nesterenkonia sphaerica TaxID=1804988 RepID=A0A5R9AA52_9MICC|nr:hypothetical protein [Nesterenkonia sphaerica]TLP75511.1 hypothetical protein FEF27_07590 [Nesterenkonia sphaerica]